MGALDRLRPRLALLREPIVWLVAAAIVVYATYSVAQHERFRTNAYDLGIYDQAVWLYARFELPWSSLLGTSILADHFGPVLALLAPLYWLHSGPETLLVAQAVLVATAAIPIYRFALERLGRGVAVAAALAYLGFVGVQEAVAFDFHLATISTFFIAWTLYFGLTGRWRGYWIALALALLTKEDVSVLMTAFGVYLALARRPRAVGLATAVLSFAYFVGVEFVVMPRLPGATGLHHDFAIAVPGATPGEQLAYVAGHPLEALRVVFENPVKQRTLAALPAAFAWLPLLDPLGWLVGAAHVGTRFLATNPVIWALSAQYNANIAPFLAVSSVLAIGNLASLARRVARPAGLARRVPALGAAALVLALVGAELVYRPPLSELTSASFWEDPPSAPDLRELLRQVPPEAIVGAQSQIVPHLSERRTVYLLLDQGPIDYLVLDLDLDPYPYRRSDLEALVDRVLSDPTYRLVAQRGPVLLIEHDPGVPTPFGR